MPAPTSKEEAENDGPAENRLFKKRCGELVASYLYSLRCLHTGDLAMVQDVCKS